MHFWRLCYPAMHIVVLFNDITFSWFINGNPAALTNHRNYILFDAITMSPNSDDNNNNNNNRNNNHSEW